MKSETKICKYCQSEIPRKAKVCPVCRRKVKGNGLGVLITLIVIIVIIASCSSMITGGTNKKATASSATSNASTTTAGDNAPAEETGITGEKFDSIQNGMSYDEVKNIIGEDGESISESEIAGSTTSMYQWNSNSGWGIAIITFQDGAVVNKTQTGVSNGDSIKISLDQYNQIQSGMSYDDVVAICGGEGALLSDSDIAGYTAQVYEWKGTSLGANATITFSNGSVMSKAQLGLE